jgi:mannose-6-phosphate isomerase
MPARLSPSALRDPIALPPNPIPRFYRGGRMLGRFRGQPDASDDGRPEDWVGSATSTWTPPGTATVDTGISPVQVGGIATTIRSLVEQDPEAMIGRALLRRIGPTPGVLVKLLDAGERLPVHCHPTRLAAARLLGSPFGKTEAWLILGTRDGGPARIWAGFREPMDPASLGRLIDEQDVGSLLAALVEHELVVGDALLIPGGVPHAIGAGTFLLELQEPTDYSIVAETRGFPIGPEDATLGLGWDRAMEFFEANSTVDRPSRRDQGSLLPATADPFFRLIRQRVGAGDGVATPFSSAFAIGVVLDGTGTVHGPGAALDLAAGSTFCLPAAAADARLSAGSELDLAWCLGPEPRALDAHPLPRPPAEGSAVPRR